MPIKGPSQGISSPSTTPHNHQPAEKQGGHPADTPIQKGRKTHSAPDTSISQRDIHPPAKNSNSLKQWRRLAITTRLGIRRAPQNSHRKRLVESSEGEFSRELHLSLANDGERHSHTLHNEQEEVQKSWLMYQAARDNNLGILLLGKADIRQDQDMSSNFGYTSAHGTETGPIAELARQAAQQRATNRAHSGEAQPAAQGRGSILSDKDWSLILNDSFILGGIHGGSQFELVLPMLDEPGLQTPASLVTEHPELFWPEGKQHPSVLVRELLGLKAFGYQPVWTDMGLSFVCRNYKKAMDSNRSTYVQTLSEVCSSRKKTLAVISHYLNTDKI